MSQHSPVDFSTQWLYTMIMNAQTTGGYKYLSWVPKNEGNSNSNQHWISIIQLLTPLLSWLTSAFLTTIRYFTISKQPPSAAICKGVLWWREDHKIYFKNQLKWVRDWLQLVKLVYSYFINIKVVFILLED